MSKQINKRRATFRKKSGSPAPQATVGASLTTQIEDIIQTELAQTERDVLKEDAARWKKMGEGSHLDDWLAYASGLMIRRRLAMRMAFVNKPEGKGYALAFGALMKRDGLDHMDKTSISAVLWLHDQAERMQMLREMREAMTPGRRSRLNSPISARKLVENALKARHDRNEEGVKVSPVAMYKMQINERDREIARLKHELSKQDDTSLFDLKKSSPDDIALVITDGTHITFKKARAIADAINARLKRKSQKPAG